jgi:hypothetical protein
MFRPYGDDEWVTQTVKALNLEHTVRREGRPRKANRSVTDSSPFPSRVGWRVNELRPRFPGRQTGAITMRFRSSSEPTRYVVKKALLMAPP